ncbi:zinc/manganese transport system ATP-binding protein [Lentzea atacamensis]|uniref:Zinc/manganese transport system ATP-binding protein n=2 Tax=Lentzea TaxID=165301 RepID=A0A316IES4_9PSEU|nr:metal ABC transporter ATP-binding protein [Lentzea atacamensis]PWK91116.1 zinc/manganese transport system ATP-binding protein [Lentzea atacamensis]
MTAISLRGARLSYGDRVLWDGLDLDVEPGEFLAVLGPNGSGKTSLMRVLLGLQPLSSGTVTVTGGNRAIGYIPQQRALEVSMTLRGRDLVGLGLDGHRWGFGLRNRRERRIRVDAAIASVSATRYADEPIGVLSGGEQQRLRVAQALVGDPTVLLCDEPLLSLDLANQRVVSELIDKRRREANTAVLFVTHELNPVLPLVDRVLYLVNGRFRIGTPDEVMNSRTLSELYRTPVEVVRVRDQILVVGAGACEEQTHHLTAEAAS